MSTKQAYAGNASLQNGTGEYNRLEFLARQIVNKTTTATLVQVKAVEMVSGAHFVDVQPMVAQLDGAGNAVPHGTIHNLPVWQAQAGMSAIILVPLVGDIGLAIFCQSDISSVKKTKKPGNPGSRRKFDWADGIYLGGLLNPTPTQTITLSDDDGITITSANKPITINTGGGDVAIATGGGKLTTDGDVEIGGTLKIGGHDYSDHKHSGVTTGGGTSGVVVP